MEPLVFKPDRSRNSARRIFGGVIDVSGGGLGCLVFLAGLFMIPVAVEGAKANRGALWLLMLPAAGLLLLLVFSAFGAVLAFTGAADRIVLSAEAITHQSGKATTRLSLHEITKLGATWVRDAPRVGHWELVISANSGGRIALGIAQGAYLAIFDVQAILKALLPLLPGTVEINPRIQAYASTGRV
jgi:hypothetical protein